MIVRSRYTLPRVIADRLPYLIELRADAAFKRADGITVGLAHLPTTEGKPSTVAWAMNEFDRPKIEAAWLAELERRLPEGIDMKNPEIKALKAKHGGKLVDEDGFLLPDVSIPAEARPQALRDFERDTRRCHRAAATDLVRLIRWLEHRPGDHVAILGLGLDEWSSDGTTWHRISPRLPPIVDVHSMVELDAAHTTRLGEMVVNGEAEPVAHEFLREALGELERAPRSALALAAMALEIGVKRQIGHFNPDLDWMIMEAPTPPVVDMLTNVVPKLGRWKPLPNSLLDDLKALVSARNSMVHRGKSPPDYLSLRKKLNAVHTVLYLLDWQRGHDWAEAWVDLSGATVVQTLSPILTVKVPEFE